MIFLEIRCFFYASRRPTRINPRTSFPQTGPQHCTTFVTRLALSGFRKKPIVTETLAAKCSARERPNGPMRKAFVRDLCEKSDRA